MPSFGLKMLAAVLGMGVWAALVPAGAAGADKPRLPVGEFYATKMVKPPTIDGHVGPGEWGRALAVSGFITAFEHSLQNTETTAYFGFDDTNFYFLMNCLRGNKEWRLVKSARQNDDYSFGDSSVEVWVTPPTAVPETYQNILNTYPAVQDVKNIPSRGYSSMGWKGNWKVAVTESDERFIIEASIPIKDFGFPTVHNGDVWQFLLCRACPGALSRVHASWGVTQGYAEIPQHPKVHLMDDEAVLQVLGTMSLFTGKYELPMAVAAPAKAPADVAVELRWQKEVTPADDDRVEKQDFSLKAGERKEFKFTGDVSAMKKGCVAITATKKDGTVVYRHWLPFEVTGYVPAKPARPANVPPPQELSFRALYGPGTNSVLVKADILDMAKRKDVASAEMKLIDPKTGKVIKSQPMPPFIEWYADGCMSLEGVKDLAIPVVDMDAAGPALEYNNQIDRKVAAIKEEAKQKKVDADALLTERMPGDAAKKKDLPKIDAVEMKIVVEAKDKAGNVLLSQDGPVALKRYKAAWMDSTVGITDKVIPPWTPMTWADGTVGVWNRKLAVDGLGLVRKIDNGGTDQIARMRYVAVVDGKETQIVPSAPKLIKQTEAAIQVQGTGTGAALKLAADTTAEFDGFVLTNLTIAPDSVAKIDGLYLEVVLPEAEATHFCTTAGGWAAVHDVTPAYWSSQSTASGMLLSSFVPYVWLTNSDRAFLWFADSDKGWITDEAKSKPTIEVIRKDRQVTLRVHFIEVPTELKAPTALTWGYQTFPSRPLPPGWRSIICSNPTGKFPHARNTYFWCDADWAVLWPYYASPFPWSMEKSKSILGYSRKNADHRPCPGSIAHSIGRYRDYEGTWFPEYVVDWGGTPGIVGNADVTNSRGPNNFRLYNYQRWVREAGFRGLYVDENYLGLEENFLTGSAYYRPDGRLQRAYSYIGLRDYFKRLKIMFHENNVPAPNLWQHISSGAAYHAWFGDVFFEGENVEPTNVQYDYIEVLPAGRMRAIGSAVCAGGAMTMMCQSARHRTQWADKHTHQFVGWVMAHDILPEQVELYYKIAEDAHLYEAGVEFLPYWKPGAITTATPKCIVSAHKVGKRAVLWIVNTDRKDQTVDVAIDWAKLGLDRAATKARNAETGQDVALTDKGLSAPVLQRDFVAVHLVQE
jgi:hypothetical protein